MIRPAMRGSATKRAWDWVPRIHAIIVDMDLGASDITQHCTPFPRAVKGAVQAGATTADTGSVV
jgi:hypothetical protein